MLLIHPALQAAATVLSLYVLYLGLQRFRSVHLQHKTAFNWKRHVLLGKIVMAVWLLGMIGGLIMAGRTWPGFLITGAHARIGLAMAPFILFGLVSGIYMDRVKKRRRQLPLIHGLLNLLVVIMALVQVWTGWMVYNQFVLGY